MNAAKLIDAIKGKLGTATGASVEAKFAYPFLQLCVTNPAFSGFDDHERESYVAKTLDMSIAELRETANTALLHFHWIAPGESPWIPEKGDHWVFRESWPSPVEPRESGKPAVIHFFGYKGGQARSTVLAVLARSLAESGQRVLLIDADLEAPSLPVIVGKQPRLAASTLLGLHRRPDFTPRPVSCLVYANGGVVDLLAARLPESDEDLEYDAFTLNALLDPSVPQKLGAKILAHAQSAGYDVAFVDQRTGSSPATLNWFDALPGGICIFARLDDQWQAGARFYRILLERTPSFAAAVVSFKPDEENPDTYRSRTSGQCAALSRIFEIAFLAKLPVSDADSPDDSDPAEGVSDRDRWVMWPYDQAFRISRFPAVSDLGQQTRGAISQLIELLELPGPTPSSPKTVTSLAKPAHSSGLLDSDFLIHTPVLRDLKAQNSAISYVFGRKGTGKSRLFRALVEADLGSPLVADAEFQGASLRSPDLKEILSQSKPTSAVGLWWRLLTLGMNTGISRDSIKDALRENAAASSDDFRAAAKRSASRRTFLIDGLETAFSPTDVQPYINALFEVMRLLQSDSEIREKVELRLFLRTDLLKQASSQNLEQQLDGRTRYLAWDLQGILNFMLSRLVSAAYSIFRQNFSAQIDLIEVRRVDLSNASVATEDAFSLLLPIFPERVRRVNALMKTFVTLHFSDSSGVAGSYYPRFVLNFLEAINQAGQPGSADEVFRGQLIENGRLSSAVVQYAFDEAAKRFLSAVRLELESVVMLEASQLHQLLEAFAGLSTPFGREDIATTLAGQTNIPTDKIVAALNTFKNIGIFEDRPGFEGKEWRAGRIFRSALRMKLRR